MSDAREALTQRIRELRRRHFGARGKAAFAEKLGLATEAYDQFERGELPAGDFLLRMCELTGEDLQWLLTGIPSRGTVVISGARARHQQLLARVAQAIDQHPSLAAPLEAFLSLLVEGQERIARDARELPPSELRGLIPILEEDEAPERWPDPPGGGGGTALARPGPAFSMSPARMARVFEPAGSYSQESARPVRIAKGQDGAGRTREYVSSAEISGLFPASCGIRLACDQMAPMFERGDTLIVSPDMPQRVGRAAVLLRRGDARARCRIWLGSDGDEVYLGRVADHGQESLPSEELLWSLEVLFRVTRAA